MASPSASPSAPSSEAPAPPGRPRRGPRIALAFVGVALALGLVAALVAGGARRSQLARDWVADRVALPIGSGLEPIRDAAQVRVEFSAEAPLSDAPAGWPVISATRVLPLWRARRAIP